MKVFQIRVEEKKVRYDFIEAESYEEAKKQAWWRFITPCQPRPTETVKYELIQEIEGKESDY